MAEIKVLMMGGRRCGKTSVLAAIDDCCSNALLKVKDLEIVCAEGGSALSTKQNELTYYFTPEHRRRFPNEFKADYNPSQDSPTYTYKVDLCTRKTGFDLEFKDIRGEDLNKELHPEMVPVLQQLFKESQIVIIAIDTPKLIEGADDLLGDNVGGQHIIHNRVDEITDFFKDAFTENNHNKLVVFVPLKCEKYYYNNEMDKVRAYVKKGYPKLFEFLGSPNVRQRCAVAIAPILTLGGAEFFMLSDDPELSDDYCYVMPPNEAKYTPKCCEQVMFLILKYLISAAEEAQKERNVIFRIILQRLFGRAKPEDLLSCKKTIKELIEANDDASLKVEIVQDDIGLMK